MSDPADVPLTPLEAAEKRRADRKAAAAAARDAQLAIDTEVIIGLEELLGDASTKVIRVPYQAGLPAAVLIRCPNAAEIKRYRDMVKVRKDGKPGDPVAAHELLGNSCVEYPAAETFATLCEKLPSLAGQCGTEAVALSAGEAEQAGKS